MKFWTFIILPILLIPFAHPNEDEKINKTAQPTGIILDTMGNEVELALLDGYPDHYFANIFTPVCNTGECLPVYVNIYWDLQGNYLRFDQPKGEILTKLDHVPFMDEDYVLLDEILSSGTDPRLVTQVEHYKGSQVDNQSNPVPEGVTAAKMVAKYDMVDGVTGSTLPEIKDKFVPGALYTTYTLWGLTHDSKAHMQNYTNFTLLKPENYVHFLSGSDYNLREAVINQLKGNSSAKDIHTRVCCKLLDTSSTQIQKNVLHHIPWNEYEMEIMQQQLLKTFQATQDKELKRLILSKWTYNHISDENYSALCGSISEHQDVMGDLLKLFSTKFYLTDENFDNWTNGFSKLSMDHQKMLVKLLKQNKSMLYRNQKKALKQMEKKI